jgi:hypothetical protein
VSEGDTPASACADCHDAPAAHLSGACSSCHTPDGWAASIAWVVRLSPPLSHELDGRDDCLICHDTDGKVRPAPSNHRHYVNEQCLLCHKVD